MKVRVIKPFLDKIDHKTAYAAGAVLDWDDNARIADCEKRGLIEVIKEPGETKPKRTTKTKAKQS